MFSVTLCCLYDEYKFHIDEVTREEYIEFVSSWITEKMDFIMNSELDLVPLEQEAIDLTYRCVSVTFVFKTEQDALLFTLRYQ